MRLTKKQQLLLVKLAILVLILIISGIGFFSNNQKKISNKLNASQTQVESTVDFSGYDKSKKYTLEVGKVADGDTFHVRLDGKEFKIRLLLIDTPETAKEGKAAQPFADQAKQRTEELLKKAEKNKEITEDDLRGYEKDIQKLTDDSVKNIDHLAQVKEKELLEV